MNPRRPGGLWVGGAFDADLSIAAETPEEVSFTSTRDRNAFLARGLLAAPTPIVDTDTGP